MRSGLLFAALTLAGCGGEALDDLIPAPEGQDRAIDIIAEVFVADGLEDPRPTAVLWYVDECLPAPWTIGLSECDPGVHQCHCLNGKALYLYWGCVTAVRWRGEVISDTSLAHEAIHCSMFDGWHDYRPYWDETLPRALNALRTEGL